MQKDFTGPDITVSLSPYFGTGTVGTSRAPLPALPAAITRLMRGVTIKCADVVAGGNVATDYLFVGDATVTQSLTGALTTDGFILVPGQAITIECEDPTDVYVISNAADTIYTFIGA